MASITKQKKGYRAQVAVKGVRESATFTTRLEAQAWAVDRETDIKRQNTTGYDRTRTAQEAFDRYLIEVSAHKDGERWERIRLQAISAQVVNRQAFGKMLLVDITPDFLGQWRDMRLKTVSGSTVNRELNLLSHVFTTARREWKWLEESPTTDLRRPKESPHRDRRISQDEIDRICFTLGYAEEVETKSQAVAAIFLFAIETAMRAGEICGLTWDRIAPTVAHLPKTKNGTKRDVPLSPRAAEILAQLSKDNTTCFGVSSASLDALFRKAKKSALIEGMTFHDSRHEAITRLAKKLNVLELARMVGHKDLKELQTYYNETAEEIAKKL